MRGNTKTSLKVESSGLRFEPPAKIKSPFVDSKEFHEVWEECGKLRHSQKDHEEADQLYMLIDLSRMIEDSEKRGAVLSTFHTRRIFDRTHRPIKAAGSLRLEELIMEKEYQYLKKNHPDLLGNFEEDMEIKSEINDWVEYENHGLYKKLWQKYSKEGKQFLQNKKEREKTDHFLRIQQMVEGERLRQFLPDIPEPMKTSFENHLNKIKELAYNPDQESQVTAAWRAQTLQDVAATLFSFELVDQKETEEVSQWKEKLKEVKGKKGYGSVIYAPPCIIKELSDYSIEGLFQPINNLVFIPKEKDRNSFMKHSHIALHELVHSHQDFFQVEDEVYDKDNILQYTQQRYLPLYEGFTELTTQYLLNDKVQIKESAYLPYVLAAQTLQKSLNKDNDWAITNSFRSANPAQVIESVHDPRRGYKAEEGLSKALYDRTVSKFSNLIGEFHNEEIEASKAGKRTHSGASGRREQLWNETRVQLINKLQEELTRELRQDMNSYGMLPL